MAAALSDKNRAAAMKGLPSGAKVRAATLNYLDHTGMSHAELAERIGYSTPTVHKFIGNIYKNVSGDDRFIRAAMWEFMQLHPLTPESVEAKGQLFPTKNVQQISSLFERAVEHRELVLIYGPPGTQKTFVLEHLICALHRQKKETAVYVYASAGMVPMALLRRIGRGLGVRIGGAARETVLSNIISAAKSRDARPAIIVDEAQHLSVECLEILREIHDRGGCGLALAGSHNLYHGFTRPDRRSHLEQLLSRFDHRDQLPGLQEDEMRQIAARELGNGEPAKLSEKFLTALVKECRTEDIFAAAGPRIYLSVRRLVKLLQQFKAKRGWTQ